MKFPPPAKDGELIMLNPQKKIFRFACCDCGLVHDFEFIVGHRQKLTFRAWRKVRSTAQRRRWQKIKFIPHGKTKI